MKLIKEEKINKELGKEWQYIFETEGNGIYLIEITARAKSWWQNLKSFRSFFNDDDLVMTIDDTSFPKLSNKIGLFDSEMSWNGNQLKGLLKTNLFVLYFEKGGHNIQFINDKNPFLENIRIFQIENEFTYVPTQNNVAEDGDRRPWFALAFVGFSIGNLKINISAGKNNRDDEDAKLIIDRKIKENDTEKSHSNWYWCGKLLKGQEKEFDEDLKLDKGIHYIELYADGSPTLNKIEAEINRKKIGEIPTVDNPKWTGSWGDDTEQMILARAIFGEARDIRFSDELRIAIGWVARNRVEDKKQRWGHTYYDVILRNKQYSAFNPIDKNRPFVENPLKNNNDIHKKSWQNCYKIADQVIGGTLGDPTKGANHYYSKITKDYEPPSWATEKTFVVKIDNTYFHKL